MMNKLIKTLVCLLLSAVSIAQTKFAATPVENRLATPLTQFKKYSLFRINAAEISQFSKLKKERVDFKLELPGLTSWDLSINENDILAKDYFLSVTTSEGKVNLPKPECMTYRGTLKNDINSRVSLTMTNDLIYGMIRSNEKEYFIEPLRYLNKDAATDVYVVYETKDVQYDPALTCGVTEMQNAQQKLLPPTGYENAGLNCVQNELAIASDASMFTRYGSAAAVQAHNIGVINNVIWDYVNAQFNNNIEIVIVTQNISTVAGTDQTSPLYAGTNSGTVLNNFRTWGEAGNFGVTYDNAEFWTTRDLDNDGAGGSNGIVGLAYVGVICTPSRYHILEDFAGSNPTGSGYLLRVLTTHEMGHNFNCSHDAAGSPFIMAPTVQNTVTWSAASIASADAHVGSRVCLAQCSTAGVPVADFRATPEAICTGGMEAAVASGVRQFIFSSTAAVYGNPLQNPVGEDADLKPLSPYGWSKLMTEIMLGDTARAHNFNYVALRYFNVAGADPKGRSGQSTPRATHLIKVACETALGQRAQMDVYGTDYETADGTCVRDYIHVTDLARAHLAALQHLRKGQPSEIFNCGYSKGYSVLEVIAAVKRVSGRDFPVRLAERRAGDPAQIVAKSGKIRERLGWRPMHDDLDTIVAQALAWESHIARFKRAG